MLKQIKVDKDYQRSNQIWVKTIEKSSRDSMTQITNSENVRLKKTLVTLVAKIIDVICYLLRPLYKQLI